MNIVKVLVIFLTKWEIIQKKKKKKKKKKKTSFHFLMHWIIALSQSLAIGGIDNSLGILSISGIESLIFKPKT